ncbi:MAG: Asp-tRNA(Asn)/Glu-tRNA(Gln) amidotransferase subunit GatB [Patescibacteria group bacterium]
MTDNTYSLVCGMEVHVELKTVSKMFCGCANNPFHAEKPNIHTCPVCLGMPGGLPVANRTAIDWTIKLGLALGCTINQVSKFDRKHYFYPDLPKGYQISQYDLPFCEKGQLNTAEGAVRIRRIHLEEDTGKLQHTTLDGRKVSLIDFNRGGVPLVEIVTEPDITSPAHAKAYAKQLRDILRYLDIADCDMEQGGMRLEANVSLRPVHKTQLPDYKIELKNINSFRFLEQAIHYEMQRQQAALEAGEQLHQETRGWDSVKNRTFAQRTKEAAADYRYFPDPDLPPIELPDEHIATIQSSIPELPAQVVVRWSDQFAVDPRFGLPLATSPENVALFEDVFAQLTAQQQSPNTLASDLHNKRLNISANTSAAKIVAAFQKAHDTAVLDSDELESIISAVLNKNSDAVKKYQNGQTQVLGFLMGQVMKELKSKPDAQQVRTALGKALTT